MIQLPSEERAGIRGRKTKLPARDSLKTGSVLLVSSSSESASELGGELDLAGYGVDFAWNNVQAMAMLKQSHFDLMVIGHDRGVEDTVRLCGLVRGVLKSPLPIMVIGHREVSSHMLEALRAGADDFMLRPLDLEELDVRLACLLRRSAGHPPETLRVGDIVLEPKTHRVSRSGMELSLSPIQFRLLWLLMRESPKLVSRDQMKSEIWADEAPESDALRTHLHHLRKVVDHPFGSRSLRSVPRVGYYIAGED